MLRRLSLIGLLPLLMLATPASAITANEKMETCKVGADGQQLKGAKRTAFINRCMAKGNYEPAARKKTVAKKPAAKKPTDNKPAEAAPAAPKQ
jgi:hypothetical protein